MTDLLDLLGGEWATVAPPAPVARCSSADRGDATHGCRSCMRPPTTWDEVNGGYIDGMGRHTRCSSCNSCVGSGRTSVRDPWTDALLDWRGAPCFYCAGTGWYHHAHDCDPAWHARALVIHEYAPATVWGVTFDGRTVFPEGRRAPDG